MLELKIISIRHFEVYLNLLRVQHVKII